MPKKDLRAALKKLLKSTNLTADETKAILEALAGLHADLKKMLTESGLYSPSEVGRLLASVDSLTADYARKMQAANQAAQVRAWQRGVAGLNEIVGAMELTWTSGLTGLESPLVQQFLTVNRIAGITEEMRAVVRAQVVSGVMMEMSPFEVMSAITNIIGIRDMRGFREIGTTGISAKAERIMRTELLSIQNSAAWTKLGDAKTRFEDLQQVWFATGDSRTREEHLAAHGQVVAVGEPFIVGGEEARFPGDPRLSAWNRINCRCTAAPFREEWGDVDDLYGPLNKSVEEERAVRADEE